MPLEPIGKCRCPVCAWDSAQVKSTKAELAMVYCDSCGTQIFCRTPKGDRIIRGGMVALNAAPVDLPPVPPKGTEANPPRPPKARARSFLDDL